MLLLSSLNLLLDSGRGEDSRPHHGGNGMTDFPASQLSATAWEGWWHEDAS
ncbi:hypothetical protein ABIB27_003358 [Arthrobacter sp. UYEF21]